MCLIALALGQHPRYPLVIASNRDEFLHRPAAALDWWQAQPDKAPLLGGRDLQAGGTWLALSPSGRLAMLTNVRDLPRHKAVAPSRGAIVPAWLDSREPMADFWRDTAAQDHNPFNLLAADLPAGQWWWADDRARAPRALGPGLYGLSNAALDTPWPKVQRLKRALARALEGSPSPTALETMLFAALADRSRPHDDTLPDTGVGLERERWLAPPFIRTPDARYGTRCSTLLIAEHHGHGIRARVVERQFDDEGRGLAQQGVRFERWPLSPGELPRVAAEPINAA
jgi:uncharacterized protein with NRDE domain